MRALFGPAVFLFVLVGCTKPNPNRCCNDEAECNSIGIPVGSVCDQGLLCRGNQCISELCKSSDDCDAAAPFCISGLCAEECASDTQCPGYGHDPAQQFCESGQCVACRTAADCSAPAPVCESGVCHGCHVDADCASSVCDRDSSVCIDEAAVAYVAAAGSPTSDCTRSDPCTLVHAFNVIGGPRNAIKLGPGANLMGGTGPTGTISVTIYGPGMLAGDGAAADGATVRVRDVVWNGSPGCVNSAPNLPRGTLDFERVDVASSYFYAKVCDVTIRDSKFHSTNGPNTEVPIIALDGEITGVSGATANRGTTAIIERTYLVGGAPALSIGANSSVHATNVVFDSQADATGAISVAANAATSTVRFSTFYNSLVKCGTNAGTGFITYANNIIYNAKTGAPADTVTGTYCSHAFDIVAPQATALAGIGNVAGVKPRLVNPSAQDFHLLSISPAIDAADPAAGETSDLEGTVRPQGARRDVGAFEYH